MPDWLTLTLALITAIIAPILIERYAPHWMRRKTEAETGKTEAETEKTEAETEGEKADTVATLTTAWKDLLTAARERLEVAEAGIELRDEEIRNWKEKHAILYEQYSHASAYLTAATSRIALYEERALVNNKVAEETK